MATPTFGATPALLGERYFPTGIQAGRAHALATSVLEEVASDVAGVLRSLRVEPDKVTVGHTPHAYRWLQATVLKGAAAEFARRADQQMALESIDAWAEDYRLRLEALRADRSAVLPDLAEADAGKGRSRAVYNPR